MKQSVFVSRYLPIFTVWVLLCTTAALSGGSDGGIAESDNAISNVVLEQTFLAAGDATPPSGWNLYTIAGNSVRQWRFDNRNGRQFQSPITNPAAIVDVDTIGISEFIIESPPFNASTSHEVRLSFDHYFFAADSLVEGKVEVYNGWSWVEVLSVRNNTPAVISASLSITSATACASQSKVRFRWVGQRPGFWIVDNVMVVRNAVTTLPLPVFSGNPANGTTNIAARKAVLSWLPNAPCPTGYKLYVGTNNPPDNILNGLDVGNGVNYNQVQFAHSTTYFWKVVPYNFNGNAVGSSVYTFTTGPNPAITTFPYGENFGSSMYGWDLENVNADNFYWQLTTSNPRTAPAAAIAYANSNGITPGNDWLYPPPFRMVAGHQYKVDFWTRAANAATPEALELKWGSDQLAVAMNSVPVFRDANITNTTYALSSALITAPDSAGYSDVFVGWHYFSAPGTQYLLLDDVAVTDNGVAPIMLATFNSSRLTPTQVRLSWRVLSQTNNLQYELQKAQAPSLNYQTIAGSVVTGNGTTTTPYNYSWTDNSATSATTYYRLKQTSVSGAVYYSNPIQVDGLTAVSSNESAPKEFMLAQNYPNPFNPETKIQFSVGTSANTSLKVYNVLGQVVATLFDGQAQAGTLYTVNFSALSTNGPSLTSGVYFYRLQSGETSAVKKLMLIK